MLQSSCSLQVPRGSKLIVSAGPGLDLKWTGGYPFRIRRYRHGGSPTFPSLLLGDEGGPRAKRIRANPIATRDRRKRKRLYKTTLERAITTCTQRERHTGNKGSGWMGKEVREVRERRIDRKGSRESVSKFNVESKSRRREGRESEGDGGTGQPAAS